MSGNGIPQYHQQCGQSPRAAPAIVPPPSIPAENPSRSTTDDVRTIFITGLPGDVKERELHNLLRWLPGFEASQINSKGDQPMGFALFSTPQHAVAAKNVLQDLVFDTEMNSALHTEMAKKNLFVKRGMGADLSSFDQSKRMKTGGDYAYTAYPSTLFQPQPAPVWATPGYMATPAPYDPYDRYPVSQVVLPISALVPAPSDYSPIQNTKDNPPCNTLFVGNLGEHLIEEEVRGLFSIQPGYKKMKIIRHDKNTVCFIEFNDVGSATAVHQNLQGAVLPSSGRGGIRIQFSKNPFGQRKDSANGTAFEINKTTQQ